jgi:hypothetical protein
LLRQKMTGLAGAFKSVVVHNRAFIAVSSDRTRSMTPA